MASDGKASLKKVPEQQKMLSEDDDEELEKFYTTMPLSEETTCGFWMFKGDLLQRFANKKMFVLLFGLTGCIYSSTFSYFNGTITTMEKRFKFSSKTTGIIMIGNDVTKLVLSVFLNYYASKGHRPRWIAFGLYSVAAFCFLNTLPHFIYGTGLDALQLTSEYGLNYTQNYTEDYLNKMLCSKKGNDMCDLEEGSIIPPIILFVSQFIAGIGASLYYSLGLAYMDDNIKKKKSPAVISFAYFVRMLGPALGYGVVSICLKIYISPTLTPTIDNSDPRWMGAWWLGWLILGIPIMIFTTILAMFPKTLPRAAARKEYFRRKNNISIAPESEPSMKDMMFTLIRLVKNKLYMYTQMVNIFSSFGFVPFWVFLPKYIEIQYKKSASVASFATGSVGLIFAAIGILLGGVIIQKYQPRARYMAAWNAITDFLFVIGVLTYSLLGCPAADNQIKVFEAGQINTNLSCNANCQCDYVKFSPVCSADTSEMFISACHAGCTQKTSFDDGSYVFTNCSCIQPTNLFTSDENISGTAVPGPCAMDCDFYFYMFVATACLIKLFGSMSRVTSFLVSVRCVEERDKTVSLAITLTLMSIFSLIPSPIFFGYIMDSTCLVWGKTCTGNGNCWFYNSTLLRTRMSYTSAAFLIVVVLFDILIFRNIKNLNMFDETELKTFDNNGKIIVNNKT